MISNPWARPVAHPPEPDPVPGARSSSIHLIAALGVTVLVLGIDHGGTGRGAWGLAALCLAAAAVTLLRRPVRASRPALAWLSALAGLTGWAALSSLWSAGASVALVEADRAVLYLAVGALVVIAGHRARRWLPHAIVIAVTAICLDCVALRAFPWLPGHTSFLGYGRLYEPVGYWNALGIVAAMGGLIALQIANDDNQPRGWRISATAALAVTLPVMYLTFSRGSVIAFAAGLAVSWLTSRHRIDWTLCTLGHAVAPALVIVVAAHQQGLVSAHGDLAEAGDVLAAAVLLGAAVAVPIGLAIDLRPRRIRSTRLSRRAAAAVLVGVVAAAAIGLVAEVGSPSGAWHRADAAFNREIWFKRDLGGNLNNRYGELSLSGRTGLWDGAWQLGSAHPLIGAGAGSFGPYWESLNREPRFTHEALSLYLETFAELGAVGVALLAVLVFAPVWVAGRGVRAETALVLGAFAAFALHAAQDMDWEWPVVSVVGLTCAALVVCGPAGSARGLVLDRRGVRAVAAGAAAALALISLVAALVGSGVV